MAWFGWVLELFTLREGATVRARDYEQDEDDEDDEDEDDEDEEAPEA